MKHTKNKTSFPLVSVVMPMRNSARFVMEAVQSIQKQTYPRWELIVVDDASTDKSYYVVKRLASKDGRIRIFRNKENLKIGATMNKLLKLARGKYIARMDADDVAYPKRLEKQVAFLEKRPNVGILGGFMVETNAKGKMTSYRKTPLDHENIYKGMIASQTIQNPTLMINRNRIPKNELRYSTYHSPVDDLDFMFRQLRYVQFANIPEYLMKYRRHEHNSSLENIKRTFWLTWHVRMKAITSYGYAPSGKYLTLALLQAAMVTIVPNKLLYEIFKLWKLEPVRFHNAGILSTVLKKLTHLVQVSVNQRPATVQ